VKQGEIHADVYGSDHCPVSVELSLELENDDVEESNFGKLF
jgi:ribosomal protein L25 (general stress protein Ctc)